VSKRRTEQAPPEADRPPDIHTINPTGLYFADDVRRIFRLRLSSLRRELRLGRLKVAKRSGRYIFLGKWLLAWIEDGEVRPAHPVGVNGHTSGKAVASD
jgi:hypothetical protein